MWSLRFFKERVFGCVLATESFSFDVREWQGALLLIKGHSGG